MSALYILIPIVILSLAALFIFRPKLLALNKKHTRYLRKPISKYGVPIIKSKNARFVKHPPIVGTKNI